MKASPRMTMAIGALLAGLAACGGGSSDEGDIKTPGDDCSVEAADDQPWCEGNKNVCVDNTCRLPCEAADGCAGLLNHKCCEVDSTVTDHACMPEALVTASTQCL